MRLGIVMCIRKCPKIPQHSYGIVNRKGCSALRVGRLWDGCMGVIVLGLRPV